MNCEVLLTDGDAMAGPLLRQLVGPGDTPWEIDHCHVVQARRHLSEQIREEGAPWLDVCYQLDLRNAQRGTQHDVWLYAKAYSEGRSMDAYRAALPVACVIPDLGSPVMHMPELDLVVWPLPNDPVMGQLPALLDPVAIQPHLRPLATSPAGPGIGEIHIVRYEPEDHCLARIELGDASNEAAIYGKSYAGEKWRDARDCMHALWCRGCVDPRAFVVGRPLGSCPALHAIWQEEVRGEALADRLAGPFAEATLDAAAAAAALAVLHSGPLIAREARPIGDAVTLARRWCATLARADGRFAADLDAMLFHLERAAAPPRRLVAVHGDFHIDQMQWWNGRIALFDYDSFTIDSPARDVADMVGHLLCREDGRADWPLVAAHFVELYRLHCGGRLAERELDWYLQLMLLREAHRSFVRHRAGWQERTLRALVMARAGIAALPHPDSI